MSTCRDQSKGIDIATVLDTGATRCYLSITVGRLPDGFHFEVKDRSVHVPHMTGLPHSIVLTENAEPVIPVVIGNPDGLPSHRQVNDGLHHRSGIRNR